jgi:hypothetical protein
METEGFIDGSSGTLSVQATPKYKQLAGNKTGRFQPVGRIEAQRVRAKRGPMTGSGVIRPRKSNPAAPPATKQPDGQITSAFPKSSQAPDEKIFRFRRRANH